MILKPENHSEWLQLRRNGIGGSDAGAVKGKKCQPKGVIKI